MSPVPRRTAPGRRAGPGRWLPAWGSALGWLAFFAGQALAAPPAPTELAATVELQIRDRWADAYWVKLRWTAVAETGLHYITQAALEDRPERILEHGLVRDKTVWSFPGMNRGVNYLVRVRACSATKRNDCSPWATLRVPIPRSVAEMQQVAINPAARVVSRWETEFNAAGKEWLGPYWERDPQAYGAIWRRRRDLATCPDVADLARAPREAQPALTRILAAFDAQLEESRKRADWVVPAEVAKAEVLAFNGREQEALAFLKERMARRISASVPGNEALDGNAELERERLAKLSTTQLRILASLRSAEAEQVARRLVDAGVKNAWRAFARDTTGPMTPDRRAKLAAGRDGQIARLRADVLGEPYVAAGRFADALALHEAVAAQWDPDSRERPPNRSAELRARMALAGGGQDEAEALLRAYAAECQGCAAAAWPLARLLVSAGRPEAAAGILVRLKIEVAEKIEALAPCMGSGSRGARYTGAYTPGTVGTESMSDAARAARPFPYDSVVEIGQTLAQATALGSLLLDAGRNDDAIAVLDPALALQRAILGVSHPSSLDTLAARARAEQARGQAAPAAALWSEWLEASGVFLSDRLWNVGADYRRGFLRSDRAHVSRFLRALIEGGNDAQAARQALTVSLGRKGVLVRMAADTSALARASKEPRLTPMVETLIRARATLAEATLLKAGEAQGLSALRQRLYAAETDVAGALRSARPPWSVPTAEQVLERLAEDEALVDFQVFRAPGASAAQALPPEQMLAVVATRRDGLRLFRWPDTVALQDATARYRRALFARASGGDARTRALEQASADLYTVIWQPLAGALQGMRRVALVPDGPLYGLPLQALKPLNGSYLIEQFRIAQLTSPRDLLWPSANPDAGAEPRRAIVLGAPEFGKAAPAAPAKSNPRGTRGETLREVFFSPLPGTLEESRQVAALLKPKYRVSLLNGTEAKKAVFVGLKAPTILHLATHGFYLDETGHGDENADPVDALARSGLALANVNLAAQGVRLPDGDDGILTALEVLSLNLNGTRLVTLSACETGVGMIEPGEGVHGLVRSFREAGASAVVATLWPIADDATSAFMQRFYRRLVDGGEDARTALRNTQIEFLQTKAWADPLYWAPFVLIGR
jgi:CHAT domain-containing protein